MCSRNAFPKVVKEYAACDPLEMAERGGAHFKGNTFVLEYCGLPLSITYPSGEFNFLEKGKDLKEQIPPPAQEEKVVILQYLTSASGLPVRGQGLSFLDLKGGPLHWKPFQKEALIPLAQRYYNDKDKFLDLGKQHGGELYDKGDAGIIIPVLPRLPLTFILWEGGGEFAPRSMVLFDSVSESYLATASLYVLAIQVVIRIWFPGDTRFENRP